MLVIKQFGPITYAMGTLQEILAGTGIAAKVRALPNDVAGCTLEMGADGLWAGNLGTLTQAQADALVAAGVMASVKAGASAQVDGGPVTWRGAAAGGWVSSESNPGAARFGLPMFNAAVKPRLFVYADSNGAGQGASNRNQAFPSVLAALLGWRDGSFFGYGRMGATFDPRTDIGGFSASSAKDSPGSMVTCSGASASDFKFSPGVYFDSFDFWYPRTGSANTQVVIKIDGVTIDTINQTGANALLKKSYQVTHGLHTVSVQSVGTGTAYFIGIETHDSFSDSVEICNCSISGASMTDLTNSSQPWTNLNALKTFAPTAVILHCTINDLDTGVTPAALRALIDKFVNTVNGYGIDQVLTASWAWENSTLSTDGTLDIISEYLKKSASAVKGAWADMRFAVGASGSQTAARGWKSDNWHLNASGYAQYAPILARIFF